MKGTFERWRLNTLRDQTKQPVKFFVYVLCMKHFALQIHSFCTVYPVCCYFQEPDHTDVGNSAGQGQGRALPFVSLSASFSHLFHTGCVVRGVFCGKRRSAHKDAKTWRIQRETGRNAECTNVAQLRASAHTCAHARAHASTHTTQQRNVVQTCVATSSAHVTILQLRRKSDAGYGVCVCTGVRQPFANKLCVPPISQNLAWSLFAPSNFFELTCVKFQILDIYGMRHHHHNNGCHPEAGFTQVASRAAFQYQVASDVTTPFSLHQPHATGWRCSLRCVAHTTPPGGAGLVPDATRDAHCDASLERRIEQTAAELGASVSTRRVEQNKRTKQKSTRE